MEQATTLPQIVLGIETSCDETAAAIVSLDGAGVGVCGEAVWTQIEEHVAFGGVVPELAARAHAVRADATVRKALDAAGLGFGDLTGIAATAGPGLIGGVMVGLMTGKAIAQARGLPFIGVNHLEGHALSPALAAMCPFPYLLLLVSGGHCQFIAVKGLGAYERLGSTIDDAAGEAFDKTARTLGLGYPGGPAVEACARSGDETAVDLPRPLLSRDGLDMSFSGLKTAVLRAAQEKDLTPQRTADICASFQAAMRDVLVEKSRRALHVMRKGLPSGTACGFVVAGGVAANGVLRERHCLDWRRPKTSPFTPRP